MPADVTSLEYAPVIPSRNIRRQMRRAFGGLAVFILLAAAAIWGPAMVMQAWFLRAQQHCLTFTLPPNRVVYANDPQDSAPLFRSGYLPVASVIGQVFTPGVLNNGAPASVAAGYIIPPLGMVGEDTIGSYANFAGALRRFEISQAPRRTGAFLHALTNRYGTQRLVAVLFIERQNPISFPPTDTNRHLELDTLVWNIVGWHPGSRLTPLGLTMLPLSSLDQHRVRVFAGQLDPKDTSHFTLPYDIDRKPGLIDGWLDPADRVHLQIRGGPAPGPMASPGLQH